jgi:tetraacyldisaccharide 4'-kinase
MTDDGFRPDQTPTTPIRSAPNGPIPGFLGVLFSKVFATAVARRNAQFDEGLGVTEPEVPVICVGNISVGGTGKTPMVRHIVRVLEEAGHRPAVLLRGYKAEPGRPSDEQAEHQHALPGVPVIADPNRARALARFLATPEGAPVDCAVLDDGFQHRRLARDLDIVLIDSAREPWRDRLLPAGWLREPTAALARAGAVVLTHAELIDEPELDRLRALTKRDHGQAPIAVVAHDWESLEVFEHGADRSEPIGWLKGKRVFPVCAIAAPEGFFERIRTAGAVATGELPLRDHDHFRTSTIDRIRRRARNTEAEAIVCTAKDWAKLSRIDPAKWPCPVVRPRLRLRFVQGKDALRDLVLETVEKAAKHRKTRLPAGRMSENPTPARVPAQP